MLKTENNLQRKLYEMKLSTNALRNTARYYDINKKVHVYSKIVVKVKLAIETCR